MKRLGTIVVWLSLWACTLAAQQRAQYSVRHYSVSDGLSQNTVMAILQDRDGFMWFGTWDGLNRFDGYEFRTYKPTLYGETLSSNRIDMLYEDSLGYVWMRTYSGAYYLLNKHTEQILATNIQDTRLGRSHSGKSLIVEPRKGEVWVAGGNNLLRMREHSGSALFKTEPTQFTLHGDINSLLYTNGTLWAGTTKGLESLMGEERSIFAPGRTDEENCFLVGFFDGKHLWFGTEAGILWRFSPRGQRFERIDVGIHSPITNIVSCDANALIITTEADGFVWYDKRFGHSEIYNSSTTNLIRSNRFYDLYVDRRGCVWMENEERGVLRFRPQDKSVKRYMSNIDERYDHQLNINFIAFEDKDGCLWINPQGGGFACYDEMSDSLVNRLGGVTNMIHSAYMDSKGSLWLGTYDLGLDRISVVDNRFELYDLRQDLHHSGELRAMLQRRDSTLVLATKDKRVRVFSRNMVYQTTLPVNALIYSMLENADGTIWMGSKTDGLFLYTPDSIVNYRADGRACSLLCNDVYDLCYGPDSTLYVATFGGGVNIFRNGKFIHQENHWTGYPERFGARVRDLLFVDDTTLFAATTTGVLRINTRTLETQATPYFDIRALHQTHDGHLWIGTFGGGLIEVINPLANPLFADENINIYNLTNGLVSDIVLAITEDPSTNDIWFSYEAGLTHLSMDTRTFQHFSALEAEKGAVFGEAHGLMLNDGQLLFGYSFGACRFDPNRIIRVEEVPRIQFTNFLVFNQPLQPTANGPLRDAICYAPRIILNHSQSVFSIEYAALAFPRDDDRVQYAYKMDGVDADWNYVGTLRRATYTRLKRGDFTFRVRSTNTQGVWVDNERTLSIHVCAPVWLTGWAFMLYALLLLLIAFALYETILFVTRLRQEVAVEQKVTEIKLRFFTNISHELRTPLTLITGPVENVLKNEKISPSVRSQLEIVASNSARMLRMINQILDFRKIQNHKMTMKIQQIDISRQVEETCANFNKEAADKHILYSIENDLDETTVWLDKGMLDTIIYNLLSNAFKYTDEGGSITVRLGRRENYVTITVADTGIGIPKDKRSMLFERFASQNEIHAAVNKTGTGIGLNLVKELVDLQHGFIEVESEQGKGSAFTVLFPLGSEHFENDTVEMMVDDTIAASDEQLVTKGIQPKVVSDSRYDILVVDDNEDMCRFLTSFLSPLYSVREAGDGYEALEKIRQQMPDMIISDLMMPNMDGLQLTDRLKNDTSTSHIPIILLTAKSAIESRLEALKYGADDYITKPFSPEYLMTRIENILRQRKNLQETYRSSLLSLQPKQLKEQSPDETFLAHLLEYMERNMDNSDLTVDDLVREMTLGRTVFFNKLKSLTGLSPVEFIREVRIKRAAQLLEKGHYNVTEITYMVGMNDSRYFAKCFKNAFGVTPTEYKKSLQTDESGNNAEENEK